MPASDPMPTQCGGNVQENELIVQMGGGTASRMSSFPHYIIYSSKYGQVLTVDRAEDGTISLFLEIRGLDNKVITRFDENGFVVNRNALFEMRRKDRSSLVIIDDYGKEVLNARYLNPHALRITGMINYAGAQVPLKLPNLPAVCLDTRGMTQVDMLIP